MQDSVTHTEKNICHIDTRSQTATHMKISIQIYHTKNHSDTHTHMHTYLSYTYLIQTHHARTDRQIDRRTDRQIDKRTARETDR